MYKYILHILIYLFCLARLPLFPIFKRAACLPPLCKQIYSQAISGIFLGQTQ